MGLRDEFHGVLTGSTAVTANLSVLYPATVYVQPLSGDSVLVEYSVDGVLWYPWPNATATTLSTDVLDAPVRALRATRTAGSGTTSRFGVIGSK